MSHRTRAERRHNTAVIKARRNENSLSTWGQSLEEGSCNYSQDGERKSCTCCETEKAYRDTRPARQNTVIDADFEDNVIHHKASTRVDTAKAKERIRTAGRKGRGVYPGAEYCPIDSAWAIAHAAQVQAQMAVDAAAIQYAEDYADTHVTGLSIEMLEFMQKPAYALGRWNLGYRQEDLAKIA